MRVSPSYCSPELARAVLSKQADRMRASCALDMWAFGLIVFELFARQPFFSDKPDTMQQLASYAELEVPKDIVDDIQVQGRAHETKYLRLSSLSLSPPPPRLVSSPFSHCQHAAHRHRLTAILHLLRRRLPPS